MSSITTPGIVLRTADYKENDKMLTLLTPRFGRVSALCRGCKKPKSPFLSAGEPFSLGEFVFYKRGEQYTVTAFSYQDAFYPLRENYEKLSRAFYVLSVCETAALPDDESSSLFTLLLRTLSRLAYTNLDENAVTAAFLLMLSAINGYRPELENCVRCGKNVQMDEKLLFHLEEGGLVCENCHNALTDGFPLAPAEILWMKDVLKKGVEKTEVSPENAPLHLLRVYTENKLEKHFLSGKEIR